MSDATFECENCGKSVPAINREIHAVRCRGGPQQQQQQPSSPSSPFPDPSPSSSHNEAAAPVGADTKAVPTPQSTAKGHSRHHHHLIDEDDDEEGYLMTMTPSAPPAPSIDVEGPYSRAGREVVSLLTPSPTSASRAAGATATATSVSAAAAIDDTIDASSASSSWSCPRCTLINSAASASCTGCEHERIRAWACPACTFINDISPGACDMCGTANPDQSDKSVNSRSSRHIHNDLMSAGAIVDRDDSDNDDVIIENWRCSRCGALNSSMTSVCARCSMMQRSTRPPIDNSYSRGGASGVSSNSARSALAGAALGAVVGAGASLLQSGSLVEGALRGATWGAVGGLMANTSNSSVERLIESDRSEAYRRPNRRRGPSSSTSSMQPNQRQRRGESLSSSSSWSPADLGFPMTTVSGEDMQHMYAPVRRRTTRATRSGAGGDVAYDAMLHRHIASLLLSNFMIGSGSQGVDIDNMSYDELYERFGGNRPRPASDSAIAALPTSVISEADPAASCSICLEPLCEGEEAQTLPCLHRFHTACSEQWLRQSAKCPICKHDVAT